MTRQAILEAALALSEDERMELVTALLESLGPDSDRLDDAAFDAELQRRSKELDDGTAEVISWSELKKELF
jgi:putative addiction module component (TIGR02574 family)